LILFLFLAQFQAGLPSSFTRNSFWISIVRRNIRPLIKFCVYVFRPFSVRGSNVLLPLIRNIATGLQQAVDWFNALTPSVKSFIAIDGAAALALIIGPITLLIGFLPHSNISRV